MADVQKTGNRIARHIVTAGSWLVGLYAPIQGIYDFIRKGNLASLGVTTNLGLPRLLFNICYAAGTALSFWMLMMFISFIVLCVPVSVVLWLLVLFRLPDALIQRILYLIGLLAIVAAAILAIVVGYFVADPLRSSIRARFDSADWMFVVIGAIVLAVVYVRAYISVKKALQALEAEGVLGTMPQ